MVFVCPTPLPPSPLRAVGADSVTFYVKEREDLTNFPTRRIIKAIFTDEEGYLEGSER
jgi:hypothetical protein